jgi:iron-sulfur cluster assembly protein
METMIAAPVSLTQGAAEEVKRLMNEIDFDKRNVLRVGVKGGG